MERRLILIDFLDLLRFCLVEESDEEEDESESELDDKERSVSSLEAKMFILTQL